MNRVKETHVVALCINCNHKKILHQENIKKKKNIPYNKQ